jgi:hypothetical protein
LLDDEVELCSECVKEYVNHPSPTVRLSFLREALDAGWIDSNTIMLMTKDPDSSIALTAATALREYVPYSIRRQLA